MVFSRILPNESYWPTLNSVRHLLSMYMARFRTLLLGWKPLLRSWQSSSRIEDVQAFIEVTSWSTFSDSLAVRQNIVDKIPAIMFSLRSHRSFELSIKIFLWLQNCKTRDEACLRVSCLIFLEVYFMCYILYIFINIYHTSLYMYNNISAQK